ncbi:MAG: DMT family transporter [Euryarchaeota archaeon]|nr:DMT family transporter [Euryarchaeota archaeon]
MSERQEPPTLTLRNAWALAIVAHLFWGYLGPGAKVLLDVWPPWTLNAVRLGIATVALMFIYGRDETVYGLKALLVDKHLMILGVVGVGITFQLYFVSLLTIEATAAAVLIFLAPFLTAVLARLFIGEPIGLHLVVAATATFIGAWLALFGATWEGLRIVSPAVRLGLLINLGSVFLWSVYTTHLRVISPRYPTGRLTIATFTAATALYVVNALIVEWGEVSSSAVLSPVPLLHLVLYIAVPSIGAYLLYTRSITRIGAGPITILLGLELLATAILAHFLLGERFPPARVFGLFLAAVSVAWFVWMQTRVAEEATAEPVG